MANKEPLIRDRKVVESIQKDTKKGLWNLNADELWWRDHQQFLLSRGYMLRPRFRPGWVPSWLGTDKFPTYCEDSLRNMHSKTIDATRTSDRAIVFIKRVPRNSNEVSIGRSLSSVEQLRDPMNHCVPTLDTFDDELGSEYSFIVMPILRQFNDPPFFSVDEVIDFFNQALEGLIYMHHQGVAHRDLSDLNVMLDAQALYPESYHPSSTISAPSLLGPAKALRRSEVKGVRYYFIDFGLSTRFAHNETRLVTGNVAQDAEVPELSLDVPYDPFAVDVFTLGNLFKTVFVEQYSNLSFLRPLTTSMTKQNPKDRPIAQAAFSHFQSLISQQNPSALQWRLRLLEETTSQRLRADFSFLMARLMKNRIFLASVLSLAAGSFISLLYGPRAVIRRLKTFINRSTSS